MSDHVFYAKGNSNGNHRKVVINNATLLVGKAPTRAKRIKLKLSMGLSTQSMTGTPEWIAAAHEFVAKNHDPVKPDLKLNGFDIGFSDTTDNLFRTGELKASKCQLRSFLISEVGDSEAPDVVMTFLFYASFSTPLWEWVGQMAGLEVWASFDGHEEQGGAAGEHLTLTLTSKPDEEDEEDEEQTVQ